MEINVHEAKTHLSKLLERVALGEEVIIAKAGTPVAKLIPFNDEPKTRIFGSARGEFLVPDDFDEADREIEAMFYDGEIFPGENAPDK
jgi:prevent-host-death family protein